MENEAKPEEIKVWHPLIIGILTLYPDYVVGAALAAVNAHRLKEKGKRNLYLFLGLPYILIFWVGGLFFMEMETWVSVVVWFVRAGLAFWLYTDAKKLIEKNLVLENITNEKLTKLIWVVLGLVVVTVLCYLLFVGLMMTFNSQ